MKGSIITMSATPVILPAPSADFSEALSTISPFRGLPNAVINSICENADCRHYSAGQTVFSMGQFDGSEFFIVLSGVMRISLVNAETGAMLIDDIRADGVFALELALSEQEPETFQHLSVTAEEELTLVAVDAASLRAIAAQRPSLMRNMATFFAAELAGRRYLAAEAEGAPEQRVFAALLQFVERDAITGQWLVPQMPKHRELADKAGVEEAATAAAVATLIQEGVARREYPGLVINDMSRLNQLAS